MIVVIPTAATRASADAKAVTLAGQVGHPDIGLHLDLASRNERAKLCFQLPDVYMIDLAGEDPDVAARSLRQSWSLGETPE